MRVSLGTPLSYRDINCYTRCILLLRCPKDRLFSSITHIIRHQLRSCGFHAKFYDPYDKIGSGGDRLKFLGVHPLAAGHLIGMYYMGDPFHEASAWDQQNEIGVLWNRWSHYLAAKHFDFNHMLLPGCVEAMFQLPETLQNGHLEVIVGVLRSPMLTIPEGCIAKMLPAMEYAEYEMLGHEIQADWFQDAKSQLAEMGYTVSEAYSLQHYPAPPQDPEHPECNTVHLLIPVLQSGAEHV